jgi:CheY-like chemotaxis protein
MDIQMPVMNGLEATEAIRNLENDDQYIPIIAVSANVLPEDKAKCVKAGMDDYLTKPIKKNELLDLLQEYAGRSHSEMKAQAKQDQLEMKTHQTKIHILIVDDIAVDLKMICKVISNFGYTYETAFNGIDALEKWENSIFDLILMDLQMPKMDGYDATKHIRRVEEENDHIRTPIFAVTANVTQVDKAKADLAGMDAFIEKPLKSSILLGQIEKFLA